MGGRPARKDTENMISPELERHITEAAWWLGLVRADDSGRALRALRILTEAVE